MLFGGLTLKDVRVIYQYLEAEPSCVVAVPWKLPVPYWMLGLYTGFALLHEDVKTPRQLLWNLIRFLLATKIRLVVVALILPFVIGEHKKWCKTADYKWGVALLVLWILYVSFTVTVQLGTLTPECIAKGPPALQAFNE